MPFIEFDGLPKGSSGKARRPKLPEMVQSLTFECGAG